MVGEEKKETLPSVLYASNKTCLYISAIINLWTFDCCVFSVVVPVR